MRKRKRKAPRKQRTNTSQHHRERKRRCERARRGKIRGKVRAPLPTSLHRCVREEKKIHGPPREIFAWRPAAAVKIQSRRISPAVSWIRSFVAEPRLVWFGCSARSGWMRGGLGSCPIRHHHTYYASFLLFPVWDLPCVAVAISPIVRVPCSRPLYSSFPLCLQIESSSSPPRPAPYGRSEFVDLGRAASDSTSKLLLGFHEGVS